MPPPVVNSSPLIVLSRAGLIDLLLIAGDQILVPAAVSEEVRVRAPDDPAVRALATRTWLKAIPDPPIPSVVTSSQMKTSGVERPRLSLGLSRTRAPMPLSMTALLGDSRGRSVFLCGVR